MKKKIFLFSILIIAILTVSLVANAATGSINTSNVFGGKIANTKAERIEELESSGYTCNTSGSTIEVTPINVKGLTMPYSYAIPNSIKNKTGFPIRSGQWIIGKYSGKTTITCILEGDPPLEEVVTLDTISIYGTSKI